MDSMRILNTSLPASSPPKHVVNEPPESLLQAFRSAALSVTTLYKNAALESDRARKEGYQDALDDLIHFLDRENLGLGDGEGWRVRQWATAGKTEGREANSGAAASDSDDERGETQKRARSSSPIIQRAMNPSENRSHQGTRQASPVRTGSAPPAVSTRQLELSSFARPDIFTFRSPISLPSHQLSDPDIELPDHDIFSDSSPQQNDSGTQHFQHQPTTPSVRLEVVPRPTRSSTRNSAHNTRSMTNSRSSTAFGTLGAGAGIKRRLPFGDFFDIGGLDNHRKDGHGGNGGGKRGRMS